MILEINMPSWNNCSNLWSITSKFSSVFLVYNHYFEIKAFNTKPSTSAHFFMWNSVTDSSHCAVLQLTRCSLVHTCIPAEWWFLPWSSSPSLWLLPFHSTLSSGSSVSMWCFPVRTLRDNPRYSHSLVLSLSFPNSAKYYCLPKSSLVTVSKNAMLSLVLITHSYSVIVS